MQAKKEFRVKQRERLIAQSMTWEKQREELYLYQKLFATPEWQRAQTVAVTLSQSEEIDTKPIITEALHANKKVYIPKTLPKRQMIFVELTDQLQITTSNFGVLEPVANYQAIAKEQLDLIIVPGLAYTKAGDRLSFGGGFFDRYLADYQGNTIALATTSRYYPKAVWEIEPTDIRVKKVISLGAD